VGAQDDLEQLIRQLPAESATARQRREAAARAEAERLRLEQEEARERAKREGSVPGRVHRGLENWINPGIYKEPEKPVRPYRPPLPGGIRGMLPTAPQYASAEDLYRYLLMQRGMLPQSRG
jgi:hypothetical protein